MEFKKGDKLIGTRGKFKGVRAIYLGRNSVRITSGEYKGWVGTPQKRLFKKVK